MRRLDTILPRASALLCAILVHCCGALQACAEQPRVEATTMVNTTVVDRRLDVLTARLQHGEFPGVHGVVVRQRGVQLGEWYRAGQDVTVGPRGPIPLGTVEFGPDTLHDVRSVTKSVVSLLFGIAMSDGAVTDLDAPVLDWFPEYAALRDEPRAKVHVRHVLNMSSGLLWDEWSYPYTDPRNSEIAMEIAAEPYRYVLGQPIVAAPGARWAYSGGDVALVGAIVARATRMPIEDFAAKRLFGPLGIDFAWNRGWEAQGGIARAASGLRLTPRGMAVIGQLVLDGGVWNGAQIVPRAWIESATSKQMDIPNDDTPGSAYGALFWLGERDGQRWIAANGNGGQRIWIVPDAGLVVAVTAGNYDTPGQGEAPAAVLDAVLAALR